MANELAIRQSFIVAQYHFTEIFAFFNDGLSKSAMAALLTIYRRMFWTDYLIVLARNLCRMLTIETTMMLANLATEPEAKRILTAGIFSMATQTSVMMNVMV